MMNAEPHTHDLKIGRENRLLYIRYGDQRSQWVIERGPFVAWRVKRKVKRIVKRHDKGSVKAGVRQERLDGLTSMTPPTKWAAGAENVDEKARVARGEEIREMIERERKMRQLITYNPTPAWSPMPEEAA